LQAKVADFGLLKDLPKEGNDLNERSNQLVGTPGYIDPEYSRTLTVTTKMDVYR
jgi:serine/threonine protein kinase